MVDREHRRRGHAAKLNPPPRWLAVAREFAVKEPIARNCYDQRRLPPHVGPMAVTRFLTLPEGA